MKTKLQLVLAAFVSLVLLSIQSCKYKKDYQIEVDQNQYSNSPTVEGSFYGLVTDETGTPLDGAKVTTGTLTTYTDRNGVFFFTKITTPRDYTAISVSKEGYFSNYRSVVVKAGDKHEVRVSLVKKMDYQTYIASAGGTIKDADGFSITFPAKAVEYVSNGVEYEGQVYVYTQYIDPSTDMGRRLMPGDLKGNNLKEEVTLMRNKGMAHIEIFDVNGNPLRLKKGISAALSTTLTPGSIASSPAVISLFHFDAQKCIWQEKSVATLNGNQYSGLIDDLNFWSFAKSEATIQIQMSFIDQYNSGLSGYTVKVTNSAKSDVQYALTSAKGWSNIYVYPYSSMTVELYANSFCTGFPVYTTTINTDAFTKDFGTTIVPINNAGMCRILGRVVGCGNYPVTDAALFFEPVGLFVIPDANGNFSLSLPCTPSGNLVLNAYDLNHNVFGETITALVSGENFLGDVIACDNIPPYLDITLVHSITNQSVTTNFLSPTDNINTYLENPAANSFAWIVGENLAGDRYVRLQTLDSVVGKVLVTDGALKGIGTGFADTAFVVFAGNVTYNGYPAYPGDVVGTFILNVTGLPSGATYNATGRFRAPRLN
jgi:hypothetical protein